MDNYLLEKLYDVFQLPIIVCKDGEICAQIPQASKYQSPLDADEKLREKLLEVAVKHKMPTFLWEEEMIYYGSFCDQKGYVYFVGPLARKTLIKSDIEAYRHGHMVKMKLKIPKMGLGITSRLLALAYYICAGEKIEHQDVVMDSLGRIVEDWEMESDVEHYQLEQSEEERGHNSIEYENRVLQLVRTGNVEAMRGIMTDELLDMDEIGVVAVDNLKKTEYLMVTFVALLTRAAIDGGLNPEKAYELGDVYLQQVEKCKSPAEMSMLGGKAQFDFTKRVREAMEERSKLSYIEKCKDYISKNLRKPFKVGEIAPAIGINRSYLAKKFAEVEGITIQQYIMKERCRHAANLLKYSEYSLSIISEYFCFSSQSHFGVQFKKYYGMTPNEYRNQYRYIDTYQK